MSPEVGRVILVIGIVLVVIGGLAVMGVRLPFGNLPGDIHIQGENGSIYIPLGTMHRLENPGKVPLNLIEVQSGAYLGEDDIVRVDDHYGRP